MAIIDDTRNSRPAHEAGARPVRPVQIFALLGAVVLALDLYFLARWVFGGTFVPVPSGPDVPPPWMRISLVSGQILLNALMLLCFYRFLVRPWIRERRVPIDGILCVVVFIASFFDMLSVYGQHWFTYNAYLVNFGSVMTAIPGVLSRNVAGAGQAFPILFMPALYVAGVVPLAILGCRVLRRVKARLPGIGPVGLLGICLVMMVGVDFVGEGLILIPLGFWSYEGGHLTVFGDHWYHYPFQEALHSACFYTVITAVRYFTSDRGLTFPERGIERLSVTGARAAGLRFLAVLSVVQLGFVLFYHVPQTLWGLNSADWPADARDKSYFTSGICGPLVDRACPGPGVPLSRPGSPYLDYSGRLVAPTGR